MRPIALISAVVVALALVGGLLGRRAGPGPPVSSSAGPRPRPVPVGLDRRAVPRCDRRGSARRRARRLGCRTRCGAPALLRAQGPRQGRRPRPRDRKARPAIRRDGLRRGDNGFNSSLSRVRLRTVGLDPIVKPTDATDVSRSAPGSFQGHPGRPRARVRALRPRVRLVRLRARRRRAGSRREPRPRGPRPRPRRPANPGREARAPLRLGLGVLPVRPRAGRGRRRDRCAGCFPRRSGRLGRVEALRDARGPPRPRREGRRRSARHRALGARDHDGGRRRDPGTPRRRARRGRGEAHDPRDAGPRERWVLGRRGRPAGDAIRVLRLGARGGLRRGRIVQARRAPPARTG